MTSFSDFMKRREEAARGYCRGEPELLDALTSRREPASFFGPDGKAIQGAQTVLDSYIRGAKVFGPKGDCTFDITQMAEGGDIAYWTGLQKSTVEMDGKMIPMTLRITELFRLEDGDWMLVHRHADPLKE